MTELVLVILIFVVAGFTLLAASLVLGRLVRPDRPSPEKGEVYECGEKPVGTAWVQFDMRFYVVALLFVIFDVELAFFFPWATVFGNAIRAGDESRPVEQRVEAARSLRPAAAPDAPSAGVSSSAAGVSSSSSSAGVSSSSAGVPPSPAAARHFAWLAFADILVFFGVLLVGFAYLWRRGDLEWVRSTAAQSAFGVGGAGPATPTQARTPVLQ
jgi:NADH-quinone oxidoreductase subunit A